MNKEEMLERINKASQDGYKEGVKHANPSEKTIELISNMQKEISEIPVISEKINNINKHFEKDGIVEEIKEHVKKTNGRVLKLETWRAYLLGGWAVLTAVTTILLPILFLLFMENFRYEIKDSIDDNISTAIENNNNKYFEEVE